MRSDFAIYHQHRVQWSECDPQWVVFNGHYLSFFDVAITEYIRAVGLPNVMMQQRSGAQFFACKATIEYQSPAKYDDMLDIGVRMAYLGRSSLRFVIEVYNDQSLLTTGELVYVDVDTALGCSVALPQAQRAAMLAFKITPVELGDAGVGAATMTQTNI